MNESRPGVTSAILPPDRAVEYLDEVLKKEPRITVVGIAGPGDPMAEAKRTLETIERINAKYPNMLYCLSSNGLALPEHVDRLAELGVTHVTVTMNAVDPQIGAKIYSWVRVGKVVYRGVEGAKILLERQWRYPLGRAFWEVPAGKLEAGEDPALCAARELEEETGYASDTWTPLGTICPGIGYSNEVISLYLAENPREGSRHLDPGEFLDLAWIPFEEAVRMAETGEIDDAKTIGALFRAEKCLEKRTGIKR